MPIEVKRGQPLPMYLVPAHKVHHGPYTEAKLAQAEGYLAAEEEPQFVGEVAAQCVDERDTPISNREQAFVDAVLRWSQRYSSAALECAKRGDREGEVEAAKRALDLAWWHPLIGFGAAVLLARLTEVPADAGQAELEQQLFVMNRIRELQYGSE